MQLYKIGDIFVSFKSLGNLVSFVVTHDKSEGIIFGTVVKKEELKESLQKLINDL